MRLGEWLLSGKPSNQTVEIQRHFTLGKSLSLQDAAKGAIRLIELAVQHHFEDKEYKYGDFQNNVVETFGVHLFTYNNNPFASWIVDEETISIGARIEVK